MRLNRESRTMTNPKSLTLDQLFAEALNQAGPDLSKGGLRLLTSGFTALREQQEEKLNTRELTSIYSMVAYVGYNQKICETTVAAVLLARFGADDIKGLPSRLFQPMIDFLVDLNMQTTIN